MLLIKKKCAKIFFVRKWKMKNILLREFNTTSSAISFQAPSTQNFEMQDETKCSRIDQVKFSKHSL